MAADIDFHAAGSLWFSRATAVGKFEVGKWSVVTFRANPDDVESEVGRLVCAISSGTDFRGMVFVRSRSPQLSGRIFSTAGTISVQRAEFVGDVKEFEEVVRSELLRAQPE